MLLVLDRRFNRLTLPLDDKLVIQIRRGIRRWIRRRMRRGNETVLEVSDVTGLGMVWIESLVCPCLWSTCSVWRLGGVL